MCEHCGRAFRAKPSVVKRGGGKYCSNSCVGKAHRGENSPAWKGGQITSYCEACGSEFVARPDFVEQGNGKYCSRQCCGAAKRLPGDRHDRYRARRYALPATLTQAEWEDILARYQYRCAYCGKAWHEIEGRLHQEHVIPVSQGGGYTADNIVPACHKCNFSKGGRTPEQAGIELREPLS